MLVFTIVFSTIYRLSHQLNTVTSTFLCTWSSIGGPWGIRRSDENEHFGTHWAFWYLVVLQHFGEPARAACPLSALHIALPSLCDSLKKVNSSSSAVLRHTRTVPGVRFPCGTRYTCRPRDVGAFVQSASFESLTGVHKALLGWNVGPQIASGLLLTSLRRTLVRFLLSKARPRESSSWSSYKCTSTGACSRCKAGF